VNKSPDAEPMVASQPQAAPTSVAERTPRFGINSLIGRMTGHGEEAARSEGPAQAAARRQPPVSGYNPDPEVDPEQEKIEIPAFLRRQAN
jgi:cell division protein FtsZ